MIVLAHTEANIERELTVQLIIPANQREEKQKETSINIRNITEKMKMR